MTLGSMKGHGLTTILVVDDHPFFRTSVVEYLIHNQFHVFEAGDEASALQIAAENELHGAVLDIIIPASSSTLNKPSSENGLRLGQTLKKENPSIGLVFLSSYMHFTSEIYHAIRMWNRGLAYKSKTSLPAALVDALKLTIQGGLHIDSNVLSDPHYLANELLAQLTSEELPIIKRSLEILEQSPLTPKEHEILNLIAAARTSKGIAEAQGVSISTVETHITRIYEKLELGLFDLVNLNLKRDILLAKICSIHDLKHRPQK